MTKIDESRFSGIKFHRFTMKLYPDLGPGPRSHGSSLTGPTRSWIRGLGSRWILAQGGPRSEPRPEPWPGRDLTVGGQVTVRSWSDPTIRSGTVKSPDFKILFFIFFKKMIIFQIYPSPKRRGLGTSPQSLYYREARARGTTVNRKKSRLENFESGDFGNHLRDFDDIRSPSVKIVKNEKKFSVDKRTTVPRPPKSADRKNRPDSSDRFYRKLITVRV